MIQSIEPFQGQRLKVLGAIFSWNAKKALTLLQDAEQ